MTLNDQLQIDQVNPLVPSRVNPIQVSEFSMPGTWSETLPYAKYKKPTENLSAPPCAVESSCNTKDSPICSYGITAGDNTIAMCRPTEPNCPMSRRLVPERNIIQGRWSLPDAKHGLHMVYDKTGTAPIPNATEPAKFGRFLCFVILIMILFHLKRG